MSAFTQVYFALLDFVEPLRRRLETPEGVEYLFYRYGWSVTLDDPGFAQFRQVASAIGPLERFIASAETARANDDLDATEIAALAVAASDLVLALSAFSPSNLSGLADPFGRAEFWESVAELIFEDLLEEYLRIRHPAWFLVLRAWGAIRYDATPPTVPGRKSFTRTWFDWTRAKAAIEDPIAALKQVYHWGDPAQPFAHREALEMLRAVLRALHGPTKWIAPAMMRKAPFAADPARGIADDHAALRSILLERDFPAEKAFYRIGFEVFPASRSGEAQPSGLMLRPLLEGGAEKTLPLTKRVSFRIQTAAAAGDSIGVALFPDDVTLFGGAPALGTKLELLTTGTEPWFVLGDPKGSRIEVAGFSLAAELGGATLADPEVSLRFACAGDAGAPGCTIVLSFSDADAFVRGVSPAGNLKVAFAPELRWSSKTGFAFGGAPTLAVDIPVSVTLGPVTISSVRLSAAPKGSGFGLRAGVSLVGRLGPLTVAIDGIGVACDLVPHTRADIQALPPGERAPSLGALDVHTHFAYPTGIGIALDAGGVVSGGGFLGHVDTEYQGAFELSILDIAVKAYGLIETKDDHYSAIIVLSAEFSPSITLGYGFTLEGVGGIAGFNRTIALPNIEAAIWSGHFGDLLFPAHPATAAPALMRALDSYFPAAPGRYVFGPLAKIGWGGVVDANVGLLVELPSPVKVLLVGEIALMVPKDKPKLQLHVSFAGGVDMGQKLVFFDASIHDSKIGGFTLSGDLAFRYSWGSAPVLAFSVGGFHPHYQPPANFPTLRRLTLAITHESVQITAQGYLAVTSNSVQLGGHIELTAGTSALNVHGYLGFDALVQRHPFAFSFELSAGVDLRTGTKTLASVHLDGSASGTSPWYVSATASLSLWLFDVSVHVHKKWDDDAATSLPAADPKPEVIAALRDMAAWSSVLPAGVRSAVTLRPADSGARLLVDPAGGLRVAQRVAPLGQAITRFNGVPLAQPLTLSIDAPSIAGETHATPTTEEFALAQFTELSDAQKLSLPSFARLAGGIEIGARASDVGSGDRLRAVATTAGYATTIIDDHVAPGRPYIVSATTHALLHARLSPAVAATSPIAFAEEHYVIASTADLRAHPDLSGDGSKLGALRALAAHVAANPESRGQLQILLAHEAT